MTTDSHLAYLVSRNTMLLTSDGKYVGKWIPNQRRKTKTGGFLKIQSSFCVDKLGTLTFMSFLFSIDIFLSRILPIIVCPFSFGR